ncbi:hypothetical protein B0H11DRAFT_2253250 [Mycena galericulata]|nr:hypothetical protein B0H11DRAFT_2253250 [Mycena galericulata]
MDPFPATCKYSIEHFIHSKGELWWSSELESIILAYRSGKRGINLTKGDWLRLLPTRFLNDSIIELGLTFWVEDLQKQDPKLAAEIYVFSPFFFTKLNRTSYKDVRKWTAKSKLFDKKYLLIPINANSHWYLAIIYLPSSVSCKSPALDRALDRPRPDGLGAYQVVPPVSTAKHNRASAPSPEQENILQQEDDTDIVIVASELTRTYIWTLDSRGDEHPAVVKVLSQWLKDVAQDEGVAVRPPIGKAVAVPQQTNTYDCGIYLLHFAREFMLCPSRYRDLFTACAFLSTTITSSMWNLEGLPFLRNAIFVRIGLLEEYDRNQLKVVGNMHACSDGDAPSTDAEHLPSPAPTAAKPPPLHGSIDPDDAAQPVDATSNEHVLPPVAAAWSTRMRISDSPEPGGPATKRRRHLPPSLAPESPPRAYSAAPSETSAPAVATSPPDTPTGTRKPRKKNKKHQGVRKGAGERKKQERRELWRLRQQAENQELENKVEVSLPTFRESQPSFYL